MVKGHGRSLHIVETCTCSCKFIKKKNLKLQFISYSKTSKTC